MILCLYYCCKKTYKKKNEFYLIVKTEIKLWFNHSKNLVSYFCMIYSSWLI